MFPIVLLLFLILTFVGLALLIGKLKLNRFGYWLFGGYIIILLAGVVAYYSIPTEQVIDENNLTNHAEGVHLYYRIVEEGVPLIELEQYKKEEWEFDIVTNETVSLYNSAGFNYYFPVIIERVEGQETVQITHYEVEPNLEIGIVEDYSDQVDVSYSSGILTIEPPGERFYEFSQFEKGFPFNQFDEGGREDWFFSDVTDHLYFETVFYITIPADIELNTPSDLDVYRIN